MFSRALLTLYGLTGMPSACRSMKEFQQLKHSLHKKEKETKFPRGKYNAGEETFIALKSNAIAPQAEGDDIDVPFMSMRL